MTSLDPNYFNVDTTDKVNNDIVLNNTLLYNKINDANTKTANISITTTIGVAVHIGNILGQDNITTSNLQSDDNFFKLELDTHANMPVVGMGAYIISTSGKTADVNSYNPENRTLQIPIVDAALQYDDPFTGITHILLIRNALHVPNMKNRLTPTPPLPFH